MSQFRASIRTQVYSSQMFRQEVLHRLRKTSPPRSPPGSFQAAGSTSAFPACSTDFLWEPRSPLSKKAQRVEGIPTHSLAQKQTYPQKPDSHSGEPAPPIFTSLSVIQPHPFHLMAVYGPSLSLPHSTVTPDQRALRTRDDAHFTKGFPQGN